MKKEKFNAKCQALIEHEDTGKYGTLVVWQDGGNYE
jgi:hypothetical protein